MQGANRPQILEQIVEKAAVFYGQQDFAHDISHGKRVHRFARYLQSKEGGNLFLVEAGAWLHQMHNHLELLDQTLAKLPLEDATCQELREIVYFCRPNRITADALLEAKIVFDADALDLLGPYGSIREVLCNAQARGMSWADAVRAARAVQEEFLSSLTTESARALASQASDVNQQFWKCYDEWDAQLILS